MAVDQQHAKPWQRLAAPARRRSGRVRAVFDIDREPDERIHPRKDRGNIGSRACAIRDLGLPRQAEDQISVIAIATKRGCQRLIDLDIVRINGRPVPGLASQQHIVTPHDHRAIGVPGGGLRTNGTHLDLRKALAARRAVRARADSETARSAERRRRPAFAARPVPRLPGAVRIATPAVTRRSPALRRPTSTARHTVTGTRWAAAVCSTSARDRRDT